MWYAIYLIVSLAIQILLTPKPSFTNAEAATLDEWDFPSTADKPIPVFWGRVKHSSMNDIWHGDYEARPITEKMDTGLFSSKRVTTGHEYLLGMQAALCFGNETLKLHKITANDRDVWIAPEGFIRDGFIDCEDEDIKGNFRFYTGFNNISDPYLSQFNEINPPYQGLSYIIFEKLKWGESPSLPAFAFEMSRFAKNTLGEFTEECVIGIDANPAYMIYETLINDQWGMGANPEDINKESFEKAARTLFLEGLGMSLMVDSVSSAQDIITEIEKTIDGVFRLNTETGLLELKLCRADYDVDDLLVIDESIITDVSRYERAGISNGVNVVRVTYTSADDNFESKSVAVENTGSCHATQNTEFANIAYKGITNADTANKLAMRYLIANSADMTSLEITCNEKSAGLNKGDVFVFKFAPTSVSRQVFRITSIDFGTIKNPAVKITARADVFGIAYSNYSSINESELEDLVRPPIDAVNLLYLEAPYLYGDKARLFGCVEKVGGAESSVWFDVQESTESEYTEIEKAHSFTKRYKVDYLNPDATVFYLEGDATPYISSASDSELKEGKNLSIIVSDAGQEWIAIKSATYNVSENRTEISVWRGCIDTPVLDHASDSHVWLIENTAPLLDYVFNDDAELTARNRTSHSKQSHGDGVKRNIAITNRASKPLCVSNIDVATGLDEFESYTTTVSFVRRAKESFVTAAHNSEDSDTGHDYIVRLYSDDTLLNQAVTKESSVTFDLEFTDSMRVEVTARDGDLYSEIAVYE
ncbi:phage tail protein [Vibrio navarrensis]|uniref:phage tail protein n=1 Tax=Vibrio navarrensis TaxID=29495 RepID=UPI0018DD2105|nr:phage tail protein [Vibrio navarrensis]MBH9742186.1 hypothetical protein [Vibrio navarrensis]